MTSATPTSTIDKWTEPDWKRPIAPNKMGMLTFFMHVRFSVLEQLSLFLQLREMTEKEAVLAAVEAVVTLNTKAGVNSKSLEAPVKSVA